MLLHLLILLLQTPYLIVELFGIYIFALEKLQTRLHFLSDGLNLLHLCGVLVQGGKEDSQRSDGRRGPLELLQVPKLGLDIVRPQILEHLGVDFVHLHALDSLNELTAVHFLKNSLPVVYLLVEEVENGLQTKLDSLGRIHVGLDFVELLGGDHFDRVLRNLHHFPDLLQIRIDEVQLGLLLLVGCFFLQLFLSEGVEVVQLFLDPALVLLKRFKALRRLKFSLHIIIV